MTIPDILIIYFSFGAPFAVYHFIQNRQTSKLRLAFGTAFHFVFWMPLVVRFGLALILESTRNNDFAKADDSDAELEKDIRKSQSDIADRFRLGARHISIHEFREILDRYVGLSLLVKHPVSGMAEPHHEFFAIANRKNIELAFICFERRNRARLLRHHIDARADFLKVIKKYSFQDDQILQSAVHLVERLEDLPALAELLENSYKRSSSVRELRESGEDLWLPEIQQASKSERLTAAT